MDVIIILSATFMLAAIAPFAARLGTRWLGLIFASVPLATFAYFVSLIPTVIQDGAIQRIYPWVPALDINLNFYIDGLSLLMGLLISGIGTLVFIYTQGYMGKDENIGRFFSYLTLFMGAMIGVVFSSSLIPLFIFWELTSISSFLLIGYKHKYYTSRGAAVQALLITGAGGLSLLVGLIITGVIGGSFDMPTLIAQGTLAGRDGYTLALVLVLLAAFTKSAQTPFHTWLPGAMAAPTPVSAYLHSATMVKAGIYLLARFTPILGGSDQWLYIVTTMGAVTMFIGAWLSWQNSDLKRILAYSTISVLGTLTMLLGLGARSEEAIEAAVIFLLAHALYKGCLFMVAGAIDHEAGTREIDKLSGLWRVMPITFAAAVIAALSKAGIPFFLGFVGKELLYESTLHSFLVVPLSALAVISNAMVGTSAALVALRPFLGREIKAPKLIHRPPVTLWLGPAILASLGLVFGLFPGLLDKFASAVVHAIVPTGHADLHLAIFHFEYGIPTAFVLSVVTVAGAIVLYFVRDRLVEPLKPLTGISYGPQRWYDMGLAGLHKWAERITKWFQNGNLNWYLSVTIGVIVAAISYTTLTRDQLIINADYSADIFGYEVVLLLVIVIAAIAAVVFKSRLAGIAAVGVVGFAMAVLFILYNAPDLAMTQFAIETLSVILIALIMGRLPKYINAEPSVGGYVRGFISIAAGALMTLLVLLTLSLPASSRVTPEFAARSYEEAHGRNVVNVILVDFRGLDTYGEITVLSVAGIGVYALARYKLDDDGSADDSAEKGHV